MNLLEKIAVMQAYADGKRVEACGVGFGERDWYSFNEGIGVWNWDKFIFSIKPVPVSVFINKAIGASQKQMYSSKDSAAAARWGMATQWEWEGKEFKEVL